MLLHWSTNRQNPSLFSGEYRFQNLWPPHSERFYFRNLGSFPGHSIHNRIHIAFPWIHPVFLFPHRHLLYSSYANDVEGLDHPWKNHWARRHWSGNVGVGRDVQPSEPRIPPIFIQTQSLWRTPHPQNHEEWYQLEKAVFFVRRNTIPNKKDLPTKWTTHGRIEDP